MPAKRPTRRLSAAARRRQILDAAEQLFVKRGFESVGMADVAKALKTSRPTIYTYFSSTEDILDALLEQRLEHLPERLRPYLRPEEDAAHFEGLFTAVLRERDLLMLLNAGGGPIFRRRRAAFLQALASRLNLAELPRAARATPQQLPLLTFLAVNLLSSAAYAQVTAQQDGAAAPGAAELARALDTFMRGGIHRLLEGESS